MEEISYFLAGAAFLVLAGLVFISKTEGRRKWSLAVATATTAAWGISIGFAAHFEFGFAVATAADSLKLGVWVGFLIILAGVVRPIEPRHALPLAFAVVAIPVLVVAYAALTVMWYPGAAPANPVAIICVAQLLLAVAGLMLLEHLLRSTNEDFRWAIKFLCFGVGTIFVYDFYYYADALLLRRLDAQLFVARGFITAIAVPVIAVAVSRSSAWTVDIHVSRKMVFHSVILIAAGVYLLAMAGVGFYLRQAGGTWGPVAQITFFTAALVGLAVMVASESARASLRQFIGRHFYTAKYDYREEWLRFIGTVASTGTDADLRRRILTATARILDCTSSSLWERNEDRRVFTPVRRWNFADDTEDVPIDATFIEMLATTKDVIELDTDDDAVLPRWLLEHPRAWLLVPLVHQDVVLGFIVMGRPRAGGNLTREDSDLLMTISRQAASYLAEQRAAEALADARQMQEFHRRFAFVAHDLKNIVGQLSTMTRNAERHADNPEFQRDMLATIENSVAKMRKLLDQIKANRSAAEKVDRPVDVDELLTRSVTSWRNKGMTLNFQSDGNSKYVAGYTEKLSSCVDHLIQNAIDAAGPRGHIGLACRLNDGRVRIEIEDDGPGMDQAFVNDKLFRPFVTTKPGGYGMGMFQVREYIREMKGDLTVDTLPGRGTRVDISLPAVNDPADLGSNQSAA